MPSPPEPVCWIPESPAGGKRRVLSPRGFLPPGRRSRAPATVRTDLSAFPPGLRRLGEGGRPLQGAASFSPPVRWRLRNKDGGWVRGKAGGPGSGTRRGWERELPSVRAGHRSHRRSARLGLLTIVSGRSRAAETFARARPLPEAPPLPPVPSF